ncbi:MAG: hypothetical protein C0497_06170 [Gemmatimonas sp.]|nr:hypothetical protein [Gemmatimonas sp.]
MTASRRAYPAPLTLLWELVTGRRAVEHSGPLLGTFVRLPAPLRDAVRWILRPRRRFLFGRLRALSRDRVLSGPFAGMHLTGQPAAPELLGTYERELFDVVRELASRPFRTLINLGARYGYYAVGLARLMPAVKVTAFEGNDEARAQLESAAEANGVRDRVTVAGYCEVTDLAAALETDGGVLVVCDIDGGEVALLDPQRVGALTRATILVECHGPAESPTGPVMEHRFLPTHDVRRFAVEERVLSHLAAGVAEPWRSRMPRTLEALMQEHRTLPQSWLLLTPRG